MTVARHPLAAVSYPFRAWQPCWPSARRIAGSEFLVEKLRVREGSAALGGRDDADELGRVRQGERQDVAGPTTGSGWLCGLHSIEPARSRPVRPPRFGSWRNGHRQATCRASAARTTPPARRLGGPQVPSSAQMGSALLLCLEFGLEGQQLGEGRVRIRGLLANGPLDPFARLVPVAAARAALAGPPPGLPPLKRSSRLGPRCSARTPPSSGARLPCGRPPLPPAPAFGGLSPRGRSRLGRCPGRRQRDARRRGLPAGVRPGGDHPASGRPAAGRRRGDADGGLRRGRGPAARRARPGLGQGGRSRAGRPPWCRCCRQISMSTGSAGRGSLGWRFGRIRLGHINRRGWARTRSRQRLPRPRPLRPRQASRHRLRRRLAQPTIHREQRHASRGAAAASVSAASAAAETASGSAPRPATVSISAAAGSATAGSATTGSAAADSGRRQVRLTSRPACPRRFRQPRSCVSTASAASGSAATCRLNGRGLNRRGLASGTVIAAPGRFSRDIAERPQDRGEILARSSRRSDVIAPVTTKPSPSAAPVGGSPCVVPGR